tara:strand:+ start:430 stop:645 length:216 start_codon:yes stop_codon:yes gene_type:complete
MNQPYSPALEDDTEFEAGYTAWLDEQAEDLMQPAYEAEIEAAYAKDHILEAEAEAEFYYRLYEEDLLFSDY